MRRLIAIGIVATVLVVGLAVAASAVVDSTWVMQLRAYSNSNNASTGTLTLGTKVGAIDAFTLVGAEDNTGAPSGTVGCIFSTITELCNKDYRAPLNANGGGGKVWNLSLYINGGQPGTIKLDGWMASGTNMLDRSTGGDPSIVLRLWQGTTLLWTVPYGVSGTQAAPTYSNASIAYNGTPISLALVADPAIPSPPPVTMTDDGVSTTNPTRLHATWTSMGEEFRYAIGTSPSELIVGWKWAGQATEATETGLTLAEGVAYYWYVEQNWDGWTRTAVSDGITVVLPSAPTINDDGIHTRGLTEMYATWSASDQWGIVEYHYAIGTSPSNLIVGWKSAGTATGATEIGLSLQPGETYYVYVKAKNGGGLWSNAGVSDGIVAATACAIGEAKAPRVGQAVYLSGSVVTSSATDFAGLWVESENRSAAVKVNATWPTTRGDRLDVAGIVSWADGVPILNSPELKGQVSLPGIGPLGLNNGFLANDLTESLAYAGINPVGLLVTTWGKVTSVDTSLHVFYVNDGSALADGMGPGNAPCVGLRVAYRTGWTPPEVGKYVRITGIRTVVKTTITENAIVNREHILAPATLHLPVLTPRDAADIGIVQ